MMKKWILVLAAGVVASPAFAKFVDERMAEPVAPVSTVVQPVAPVPAVVQTVAAPSGGVAPATPAAAATPAAPDVTGFAVVSTDKTIREVLARWSAGAGWAHAPQHWAVAEDYSVAGLAGPEVFGSDFRGAVRILINSTDLTSRPAQPCFYANNVVRVIPRAGICDPSAQ